MKSTTLVSRYVMGLLVPVWVGCGAEATTGPVRPGDTMADVGQDVAETTAPDSEAPDANDLDTSEPDSNGPDGDGETSSEVDSVGPLEDTAGQEVLGDVVPGCTDECANGATECQGNGVRTCGNHDADACREWSAVVVCESTSCGEATCSAGRCELSPKNEGQACGEGCFAGGTCRAGECVGATTGCGPGESCEDGECRCDTVFDGRRGSVEGLVDIRSADVSLHLRVNGQSPGTLPADQQGSLYLRHEGSVNWRSVGVVGVADIVRTQLIPGRYRVQYRKGAQHRWSQGLVTPENMPTDFGEVVVPSAGGMVVLDLPATNVTFKIKINGADVANPLPATEVGTLKIRHRGATEWTTLGVLGGELEGIDWRLIPGTYEVHYQKGAQHTWRDGILTPENEPTTFGTVAIPAAGGLVTIDMRAATVTFEGRINGVVPPSDLPESELGDLRIRHVGSTGWMYVGTLGRTMVGPNWRLLAGRYEVQYSRGARHAWREGILTPENGATTFTTVSIESDGEVVLDLPATNATFAAWMDGVAAPTNLPNTQLGDLWIRHAGSTDWLQVGRLGGQMIGPSWRLIPGRYQIRYSTAAGFAWAEGILAPENQDTIAGTFDVPAQGGALALPLRASSVVLSVTVNGAQAPTNIQANGQGILRFRHVGSTQWLRMANVGGASSSEPWRLLEGDYEYEYTRATNIAVPDRFLPENLDTMVGRFTVPASDGPLEIPLFVTDLSLRGTINGAAWPDLPLSERGDISFMHKGATSGSITALVVGWNLTPNTWRMLSGTYRLYYEPGTGYTWRSGILAPSNPETVFGCFELLAPGQ